MDHLSEGSYWLSFYLSLSRCISQYACMCVCVYALHIYLWQRADICNAHCLFKANGREQYTFTIHRYIIRCGCLNTKQCSKCKQQTTAWVLVTEDKDKDGTWNYYSKRIVRLPADFIHLASSKAKWVYHKVHTHMQPRSCTLAKCVMLSDYSGIWLLNDRLQRYVYKTPNWRSISHASG